MLLDPATDLRARPTWLGILARADADRIAHCLTDAPALPDFTRLRGPETGMAMIRARMGGSGAAFNVGEITIARCTIRDVTGRIGHGYATGRDLVHAELVARIDAALQNPVLQDRLIDAVVAPLAAEIAARRAAIEAQAQATEVKFFTLSSMRS